MSDSSNDIYHVHADIVKRFLISLCGNFDLAEDLTQETFYQAYKSIHRYNGTCKFSVWLCQIAKHVYFDYLKKEKQMQTVTFDNLDLLQTEDFQNSMESAYIEKEEARELIAVLQQAKPSYRQVFWLRAYEELSFKEIGQILEKSENWARVNYYRAKEWIRERMVERENHM